MNPYGISLGVAALAITAAFVTGHTKIAIGLSVGLVVAVVLFYGTVVYALRKWSNGGK
jgi:hypothetical protein